MSSQTDKHRRSLYHIRCVLIAYRLTLGFSFAPRDIAWRFPLAFQIFFTLCIWALCPFLPDSPRLLIRKGKYDEAREVLAALEGHGATPESQSVQAEFNVIKDILDRENVSSYTWWQLLSGRGPSGLLRRMILGAAMQMMNQISGKPIRVGPNDHNGVLTNEQE